MIYLQNSGDGPLFYLILSPTLGQKSTSDNLLWLPFASYPQRQMEMKHSFVNGALVILFDIIIEPSIEARNHVTVETFWRLWQSHLRLGLPLNVACLH